jgi:hypothetical protein
MDLSILYTDEDLEEYNKKLLIFEEDCKEKEKRRDEYVSQFIRNLYEITNIPYEINETITFANIIICYFQRQYVTEISLFSKKYFPNLKKLDLSYNLITVLENFDNDLKILNLTGNPIILIKDSFNFQNIKFKFGLLNSLEIAYFENLEVYIKWISNIEIIECDGVNKPSDYQLDYNLISFIKPSLFELSCNKIQKKKYKKNHKEEHTEFLSIINKSLYQRNDFVISNCSICDKINVLYTGFVGGDVLTFRGNIYHNIFKKILKTEMCYECYNKECHNKALYNI